jgi:hypothetical protein
MAASSAALAATTANCGAPITGGLGYLPVLGDTVSAEEVQAAIEAEVDREEAAFDESAAERLDDPGVQPRRLNSRDGFLEAYSRHRDRHES